MNDDNAPMVDGFGEPMSCAVCERPLTVADLMDDNIGYTLFHADDPGVLLEASCAPCCA